MTDPGDNADHSTADRAADHPDDHPTLGLDDVVHQRARLGILSVLVETDGAEFGTLKDLLRFTDGNLGRHLEALAAQGLVATTRSSRGRRPRTRISVTERGRRAYAAEIEALRRLVARYDAGPAQE